MRWVNICIFKLILELSCEFADRQHMSSRYVFGSQVLCWKLSALSRRFWVWGGLVWLGVTPAFPLRINHSFLCVTATSSMCFCHCIRLGSLREGPVAYSDLYPSAWPSACMVHSRHLLSVRWTEMCFSFWGGLPYELTEGDIICVFSQ